MLRPIVPVADMEARQDPRKVGVDIREPEKGGAYSRRVGVQIAQLRFMVGTLRLASLHGLNGVEVLVESDAGEGLGAILMEGIDCTLKLGPPPGAPPPAPCRPPITRPPLPAGAPRLQVTARSSTFVQLC